MFIGTVLVRFAVSPTSKPCTSRLPSAATPPGTTIVWDTIWWFTRAVQ